MSASSSILGATVLQTEVSREDKIKKGAQLLEHVIKSCKSLKEHIKKGKPLLKDIGVVDFVVHRLQSLEDTIISHMSDSKIQKYASFLQAT